MGRTKVFLRAGHAEKLAKLTSQMSPKVTTMQTGE